MKICFIAPSGYGKSTAASYLEKNYDAKNIKIADFLYEIQDYIYKRMGIDTLGKQDGELLQFLGKKIRKIDSDFLINDFVRRVLNCDNSLILNDDCRPLDYDYLKQLGFIFVKIEGFSRDRSDLTTVDKNNSLEWNSEIPCDYVLKNNGSMEDYMENIDKLMKEIKNDREVLCYTRTKNV